MPQPFGFWWTKRLFSGSAAAPFPFALFSFPVATLFSFIFLWKFCHSLSRPTAMFNHRVWRHKGFWAQCQVRRGLWADIRCEEDCGLWDKKKHLSHKYLWQFQTNEKILTLEKKNKNTNKLKLKWSVSNIKEYLLNISFFINNMQLFQN